MSQLTVVPDIAGAGAERPSLRRRRRVVAACADGGARAERPSMRRLSAGRGCCAAGIG